MTDDTLLEKVYEQQLRTAAEVSGVRTDVAALKAAVGVELAHGQRKMDALDRDVDDLKSRIPERLTPRLMSLESDRDKSRGSSTAVSRIVTALIAIAGGGAGTALVAWLTGIHPH